MRASADPFFLLCYVAFRLLSYRRGHGNPDMIAQATPLQEYLAGCSGGSDTFDFPSEADAIVFEAAIKQRARDNSGRTTVVIERTGTRVLAWLPTARKRRAA